MTEERRPDDSATPLLRVERHIKALIRRRLTEGASEELDRELSRLILERRRLAREGWWN
jgi:hypothetical protein